MKRNDRFHLSIKNLHDTRTKHLRLQQQLGWGGLRLSLPHPREGPGNSQYLFLCTYLEKPLLLKFSYLTTITQLLSFVCKSIEKELECYFPLSTRKEETVFTIMGSPVAILSNRLLRETQDSRPWGENERIGTCSFVLLQP